MKWAISFKIFVSKAIEKLPLLHENRKITILMSIMYKEYNLGIKASNSN